MKSTDFAVELLKNLIETPSLSREEGNTALALLSTLNNSHLNTNRIGNNIYSHSKSFDPGKPTLLLCSHHDTVKPNKGYTRDPYKAEVIDGKLFGLGSTDAGGALVSMVTAFLNQVDQVEHINLLLLAVAEEEVSGKNGIELGLTAIPAFDMAIIGEPTMMQPAIAQSGLVVLDCVNYGVAGHAARNNSENAIYKALLDIERVRQHRFERHSTMLGQTIMQVTVINAGQAHNQVPDSCHWVIDVRPTDAYSLEEVVGTISELVSAEVQPRSIRLHPRSIELSHPLVEAASTLGGSPYGSPTMSDWAFIDKPCLKIGPGDTLRSHTADEFILLSELEAGVTGYQAMIKYLDKHYSNNNI